MANVATERLPIAPARHAVQGADRLAVAVARERGGDVRGLALCVRSVLLLRAARLARCAQRAQRRGNVTRAQRWARRARDWAGLD